MARALWKGSITFSLINIPVAVMSAKESLTLRLRMLDKKDHALIGYKSYNKDTGHEVPRERIVKGYEFEPGRFVIVSDEELKKANPKAAQTIDIQDFVDLSDIDILYFEQPYYLMPVKNAEKGYLLLRDVLRSTGKAAIAKIVLHNRQRLATIFPSKDHLILEIMRYSHEIRELTDPTIHESTLKGKVSNPEIQMAEKLVSGMTHKWQPEKYKDTYYDDLRKWIENKIKHGQTEEGPKGTGEKTATATNVVDLMPLLKKSLETASHSPKRPRKRA